MRALMVWLAVAMAAAAWGQEAVPPVKAAAAEAVNELRSLAAKIAAIRRKVVAGKPDLAAEATALDERERQLAADRAAFHAGLRAVSVELDALEKRREQLVGERQAANPKPPAKAVAK